MSGDAYDHMEKAWGLSRNPFPAEAIRHEQNHPYSRDVFGKESGEFCRKFIRGAIQGNRDIGFLWSHGAQADTGFGKTTLMRETTKEINRDLGIGVLTQAGMRRDRQPPIAAAYSNLNNLSASGLYPVLFNAVLDLIASSDDESDSVFDQAMARIIAKLGTNKPSKISDHLGETWLRICGTAGPIRAELIDAFATGGVSEVRAVLGGVTPTARLRNGLQYLDFALGVLAAADIDHLYLMIDQLEDLATMQTITATKRSREIGRIRDMLEGRPYANRVHFIFTLHNRAAQVLERFWTHNHLPSFEISSSNAGAVVVLRGIEKDEQARELLRVYLEEYREGKVEHDLLPFEHEAVSFLREISEGRVGILLNRAHELFNHAAENEEPRITGELARRFFEEEEDSNPMEFTTPQGDEAGDIDSLLISTK